jgi:hypothetical protein
MQLNDTKAADIIADVERKFEIARNSALPSTILIIHEVQQHIEQLLIVVKKIPDISIDSPELLELVKAVDDIEIDLMRNRAIDLWHGHDDNGLSFYNENNLHNILESTEVKLEQAKEYLKKHPGSFSQEAIDLAEQKLTAARTALDDTNSFTKDSVEFHELMNATLSLFQTNQPIPSSAISQFNFSSNHQLPTSFTDTQDNMNIMMRVIASATVAGGLFLLYLLISQRKNLIKVSGHGASFCNYIFSGTLQKGGAFVENMRLRFFNAPVLVTETSAMPDDVEKQAKSENMHTL